MAAQQQHFEDFYFTARDGLKLHGAALSGDRTREWPPRRPVLCLAGLTRNGRDFHDLAMALSQA